MENFPHFLWYNIFILFYSKVGEKSSCSVVSHTASAEHALLVLVLVQKGMHKPIFLINDLQKPSIPNSNFTERYFSFYHQIKQRN